MEPEKRLMALLRCVRALILVLPVMATAAPAWAQVTAQSNEAKAVELFEEAITLLGQKQYEAACPKFLQSYELDRAKPGSLYALAECYAEAGKVASAVGRYG